MVKWIRGRLRCFAGKHERSQRHVRREEGDERYSSKCKYCGVRLERLAKRVWVVKRR